MKLCRSAFVIPRCPVCRTELYRPLTGRPPDYCSNKCRQKAYRIRKRIRLQGETSARGKFRNIEKKPRPLLSVNPNTTISYQQEYVKCGKPTCKCATGQGHGLYWYAYWREGDKIKKRYIGKKFKALWELSGIVIDLR